jgi:4-amino-4-deoxy-L-arabinose transferase-like glycosyltransferase
LSVLSVAPALRRRVLVITALLGVVLFVWRLGSTGLVDETPPLFAASARAMAETGDWLIPRVNGLPRYDKPPLVYWAMGLLYALPGQEQWNPLGTWAARLPSAVASISVMLGLAHSLLRWPQGGRRPAFTALGGALAFALSPLVLLWSRISASDALFSACLAWSLLLCWQAYADTQRPWWPGWAALGLAVLTKGPVAVVLVGLVLLLFGWLQRDLQGLARRLRPLRGLLLAAVMAIPWYLAAMAVEGDPFVRSFFGYHNLQRFTVVVNHHLQPWWFFGVVLIIASLPATPLLVLGLVQVVRRWREPLPAALSLQRFAACWLVAVLVFFTAAATKLPSYWIPATPAAGLLIALAAQQASAKGPGRRWAWGGTWALTLVLAVGFAAAPLWVPLIHEPEMPSLPVDLLAGRWLGWAAGLFGLAALGSIWGLRRDGPKALLALQGPIIAFIPLVLLPAWQLGDQLRGLPVRQMAAAVARERQGPEPLAMVGVMKPSLHYYSRQVVLYEGAGPVGLANLNDRLAKERRPGLAPSPATRDETSDANAHATVLVVIDQGTAQQTFWQTLPHQPLAAHGIYRLWRVERWQLARRAVQLAAASGTRPDWQQPRPERY